MSAEVYTLIGGPRHGERMAVQPYGGPYIFFMRMLDMAEIDWSAEVSNEPVKIDKLYYEKGEGGLAFYRGTWK